MSAVDASKSFPADKESLPQDKVSQPEKKSRKKDKKPADDTEPVVEKAAEKAVEKAAEKPKKKSRKSDTKTVVVDENQLLEVGAGKKKAPAAKKPKKSKSAGKKKASAAKTSTPTKDAAAKETKEAKVVAKESKSSGKKTKDAKVSDAKESDAKDSDNAKAPKEKPEHPKIPAIDAHGISIGPARVKSVLNNISLNPREFRIRKQIMEAAAKFKDPNVPASDKVPFNKLDGEIRAVIDEAELAHKSFLRENYETQYVKDMKEEDKARYKKQKRDAIKEAKSNKKELDLEKFNLQFSQTFYADFDKYVQEHDIFNKDSKSAGAKSSKEKKYTEWSRAAVLVNKLSIRLSGNSRNIFACFLDRIVEQFARNGIVNCAAAKLNIVQLEHAITQGPDYKKMVYLHNFISSLSSYQEAVQWVLQCRQVEQERKVNKELKYPDYPESKDKHKFEGYAIDICRSVKLHLLNEPDGGKYEGTSFSSDLKSFLSRVVYETIVRVGNCLKLSVEHQKVKTINDEIVLHAIKFIHVLHGADYNLTKNVLEERLKKYAAWRAVKREERKKNKETREKQPKETTELVPDEEEDDEEEEEEEEVEYEEVDE